MPRGSQRTRKLIGSSAPRVARGRPPSFRRQSQITRGHTKHQETGRLPAGPGVTRAAAKLANPRLRRLVAAVCVERVADLARQYRGAIVGDRVAPAAPLGGVVELDQLGELARAGDGAPGELARRLAAPAREAGLRERLHNAIVDLRHRCARARLAIEARDRAGGSGALAAAPPREPR